ncbi:7062_t:CDS:2, partial [Entrophospora sp. SA101]
EAGLIENIMQNQAYSRTLNEASCLNLIADIEKQKHVELATDIAKKQKTNENTEGINSTEEIDSSEESDDIEVKIEGIICKEISINKNFKVIIENFENYKKDNKDPLAIANIMDLTPKGSFIRTLPKYVYKEYLLSLEYLDNIIPDETHDFLVEFFGQAFSLGHSNPLQNIQTLEQCHLNDFVHPCLKAALMYCADIYYTLQKGDGIGFTNDVNKYQLVYIEGSRPHNVREKKEIDDRVKVAKNLKKMFFNIIKDRIGKRKVITPEFEVFGGTSYKLEIHLYVLRFAGCYHLVEIDNATVPQDFSEIEDFVYFYETIIKWALLINSCLIKLSDKTLKKRSSQFSYGMNQLALDDFSRK